MNLGRYDCATGLISVLYVNGDLTVRNATEIDIAFIDKLQRDNSYAVGFIQRTVWDDYVFGGKRNFVVFICEKNDDTVGYVLVTPGRAAGSYVRIQQIAVRDDARRLDYGSALVSVVRAFCEDYGRAGARLRCRADLESNSFWRALGFRLYGVWKKGLTNHVGMKASNDINLYEIDLNRNLPRLFEPDGLWFPEHSGSNAGAK